MYPRNAASPERIAVGQVVQISDGAIQSSGVSITVRGQGGAEGAGGGTIAYGADGTVYYTPLQSETNFTSFVVIAYKASCYSASVTVITTSTSVAGTVNVGEVNGQTATAAATVDFDDLAAIKAVTDNLPNGGTLSGIETSLTTIDGIVDAILVDTDVTIPGLIAALNDIAATDVWAAGTRTLTAGTNIDGSTFTALPNVTLADGVVHGGSTARLVLGTSTSSPAFLATSSADGPAVNFHNSNVGNGTALQLTAGGSTVFSYNGEPVIAAGSVPSILEVQADVTKIHGTAITETSAGRIAGNFSTFYDNADAATTQTVDDVGGGGGADPWSTALPGAYGAGTAGFILGTNLDAVLTDRTLATADYFDPATDTVATVTTLTNLPAITTNWLTAAGLATDAVNEIVDQVWLETLADHSGSSGSMAEALAAAGGAGDPWITPVPGSYTGSQAGKVLADVLVDVTGLNGDAMRGTDGANTTTPPTVAAIRSEMDSNSTQLAAIVADTNILQVEWANGGRLDSLLDTAAGYTIPSASTIASQIMNTDFTLFTTDSTVGSVFGDLDGFTGGSTYTIINDMATAVSALNDISAADVWASGTRTLTANTNLNDPTAAAIADAVWDELYAGHMGAGTFGEAVVDTLGNTASIQSSLGTVSATVAFILADTSELQTNQGNWLTATGFSTHSVADIWNEPQVGYTTAGTFGDNLDARVSEAGGGGTVDANIVSMDGTALTTQIQAGLYHFFNVVTPTQTMNNVGSGGGGDASLSNQVTMLGILQGSSVIVSQANLRVGDKITVRQATDYLLLDGRQISWTGDTEDQWPDLTGASLTFTAIQGGTTITKTCVVTAETGTQAFYVEFTAAELASALVPTGSYRYYINAVLASSSKINLVENGTLRVTQPFSSGE